MTVIAPSTRLVCAESGPLDVPADRWLEHGGEADMSVLARVRSPALDVGCGVGRYVVALGERGISALGIDVAPCALEHARARGAPVIRRSVFDRVPGAGRWTSALLLDGNIGLGGDPTALLRRVASLVRPDGVVLVELAPPGTRSVTRTVRLEIDGRRGPWFALATVASDGLDEIACSAGLRAKERWTIDQRWFATLVKVGACS